MKINIKPAVFIYDSGAFLNNFKAFKEARKRFKQITGKYPFIMADDIPGIPYTPDDVKYIFLYKDFSQIDVLTGWAGCHNRGKKEWIKNYEMFYDKHLAVWYKFARRRGLGFSPTVIPGFDNSYSWGPPLPPIGRSTEKFREILGIAVKYLDDYRIIRIDTWNYFGEWSYIKPSAKTGFTYLEVLRNFLMKSSKND